jgi:hypothetical protein
MDELAEDAQRPPGIAARELGLLRDARDRARLFLALQEQLVLGLAAKAGGAAEGNVGY